MLNTSCYYLSNSFLLFVISLTSGLFVAFCLFAFTYFWSFLLNPHWLLSSCSSLQIKHNSDYVTLQIKKKKSVTIHEFKLYTGEQPESFELLHHKLPYSSFN